jgi:D-xylose transport system permease protein
MSNELKTERAVVEKLPGLAGTVPPPPAEKFSVKALLRQDLGFLPVLFTLLIIIIYFQISTNGIFLDPRNISNLIQQVVSVGIIGIAAILVLLLGEIDLSLAAVSQACAAVTAVLSVYQDWNPWLAILAGLVAGAVIGLVNGFFIAVLRVPSFIVTLAGSIFYAGILLLVMGRQTTLTVRDPVIRDLAPNYMDPIAGWLVPLLGIGLYIGFVLLEQRRRATIGLKTKAPIRLGIQFGVAIVIPVGIIWLLQSYNGVPIAGLIWIGLVVAIWVLLTRTTYGRHLYAVGGNSEAARRAGINTTVMKLSIFALASTLAAFAGIMLLSRSTAAATQIDSTLLLRAIAAAVIGGVSLFGGRGSIWAVVLGALVIGSLENGLTLQDQEQSIKNVVEGTVLILAVTADALARRSSNRR